jgi:hypothetical protein
MSDNYPVSTDVVRRDGMRGFFGSAAGLGMLVFTRLITLSFVGPVLGGLLAVTGLIGMFRKNNSDKFTNGLLIGAGALGLATLILPKAVGTLTLLSGFGLLAFGVVHFVKFFKGLKSRS